MQNFNDYNNAVDPAIEFEEVNNENTEDDDEILSETFEEDIGDVTSSEMSSEEEETNTIAMEIQEESEDGTGHNEVFDNEPFVVMNTTCSNTSAVINNGSNTIDSAAEQSSDQWSGYKLVGDNIDKTVRPRFMRSDHQAISFNYFNTYAVKDRIDMSELSSHKSFIYAEVDVNDILPSADTDAILHSNLSILISCVLVEYMPAFKLYFEDVVNKHIKHNFSSEMSKNSEVVI